MLISKADARRNEYLRDEAFLLTKGAGVLSPDMVVAIVKAFHHYADLTALQREELVRRVMHIVIGDAATIQVDELMVVLKLLGSHAEPQHITYLLQSNAVEKPNMEELAVTETIKMLLRMDMSLTVPLDLLKRLKHTWDTLDSVGGGTGALNAQQLKHLSNMMGLVRGRGRRLAADRPPQHPTAAALPHRTCCRPPP